MPRPASAPSPRAARPPGAEDAPTLLVQHYSDRLLSLVRHYLGKRLSRKVDPEDVLQSVFRSFFRCRNAPPWDLADENSLWGLLVRITLRKCGRCLDYFQAARRDVRREVPLAAAETQPGAAVGPDPEPTPLEAALLADAAEQVVRRLTTDAKRRIFELSLQGYSIPEISARVGYYERGVERVRAEIKSLLLALMDDDPSPPAPGPGEASRPRDFPA